MRISDWSSDVCSSDLDQPAEHQHRAGQLLALGDVAFLARVLDLFRGRLFGLVGALILLCHAGLWLQAVWCNVCRGRLAWRSSTAGMRRNGGRRLNVGRHAPVIYGCPQMAEQAQRRILSAAEQRRVGKEE